MKKLLLAVILASTLYNPSPLFAQQETSFVSDVVNVSEEQLSPEFWLSQTKAGATQIWSMDKINEVNQSNLSQIAEMAQVFDIPSQLTKSELLAEIAFISRHLEVGPTFNDDTPVTQAFYDELDENLNREAIKELNPVSFALAVRRSNLRTFPSAVPIFRAGQNKDIDRHQESVVFPADAVAVLHTSKDGKWVLVRVYNYLAWVSEADLAYGDKETIEAYKSATDFLVITGDKVTTVFNPEVPDVSELQLEMGIRLPLEFPQENHHKLYGQNPYASYVVKLPVRNDDGTLSFKYASIARSKDVHRGYLTHNTDNIISQAFKFLGERYGWGHRFNGRDCSGFVSEVYRSMGILLPRNSITQRNSSFGQNVRFTEETSMEERLEAVANLDVGDLIFTPGHVMMYIGSVEGKPYIIHDVKGLRYTLENGEVYENTLNGVSVTTLLDLQTAARKSYVEVISGIKKIR